MAMLGTKVRVPQPRRRLVGRPRLLELLGSPAGPLPRLVLVAAPAGFGKTTLLTQWLGAGDGANAEGPRRSVAWLSLDADDSAPERLLEHVVAALRSAADDPGLGEDALALLETGRGRSTQAALTSLVNELDTFVGPTVLVLDDYHVLTGAAVHEVVAFLLDHLPDHVTLALTTRADPALPLARLRARGEVAEVRAADLRFTPEESAEFLVACMGLELDAAHLAALEQRTEGWAAGLQLAALSARARARTDGPDAAASFVDAFTGSHRYVLDYLVEEVLEGQPADVRDFLLDTCVLDQLTGPLCDALTGRDDGADRLVALERANLFVVPLDDERRWYRYHHLFADALRARLLSSRPDRRLPLLAAASAWHTEHGALADAVRYALAGDDPSRAADLVELALPDLRRRREDRTLREWLLALPDDEVLRRPLLLSFRGWARLSVADLAGATTWLDAADARLAELAADPTADPAADPTSAWPSPAPPALRDAVEDRRRAVRALPATIAAFRAAIAQGSGDTEGTRRHASRAVELAGPDDHLERASGAGFLGLAAWADGDVRTATSTFAGAVDDLRAAGNEADVLGATVVLAELWLARGRPDRARELYEHALAESRRADGGTPTTVGELHVGLADALREQGHLDEAAEQLRLARELGDARTLLENRYRWHLVSAQLRVATGDLDGATALLDAAEAAYLPGFFPQTRPLAAVRARLQIRQGRLDEAAAWAHERGLPLDGEPGYLREHEQLTWARLVVAEHAAGRRGSGPLDDVLVATGRVVVAASAADRGGSLVDAHVVRALAHHAAGDLDAATAELASALVVAAPGGYVRTFLDEGEPLLELLRALSRGDVGTDGGAPGRADELAEARARASALLVAADAPAPATAVPATGAEVLSEREVEVLRLLAGDLTGPEIARTLFVSVNTLRTHTRHIFTKLDVTTRRAAVSRAAELGIVGGPSAR